MVVAMMMMKELVVLVHVKNDCAFSLLNFLLSLYVCFSFAVKFDVCVFVCYVQNKKKRKREEKRKETLSCTPLRERTVLCAIFA